MNRGSFKSKKSRISSYIKPTIRKKKSKPRNTSGSKSTKTATIRHTRSGLRTKPKNTEATEKRAKYDNNYAQPVEDYNEQFKSLQINDENKDNVTHSGQIKEVYSREKTSESNKYLLQAQEKSRISTNFNMETEIMGTIATERAASRREPMNEVYEVQNNIHSKHKRKQSANIPYKMSKPHTNIEKLSGGDRSDLNYHQNNRQFLNTDVMNDEDEE